MKCMIPNLFHIAPIGHETSSNRMCQVENSSFRLSFITHVETSPRHSIHHTWIAGSTYNRWENSTRSLIIHKTSFDHPLNEQMVIRTARELHSPLPLSITTAAAYSSFRLILSATYREGSLFRIFLQLR